MLIFTIPAAEHLLPVVLFAILALTVCAVLLVLVAFKLIALFKYLIVYMRWDVRTTLGVRGISTVVAIVVVASALGCKDRTCLTLCIVDLIAI